LECFAGRTPRGTVNRPSGGHDDVSLSQVQVFVAVVDGAAFRRRRSASASRQPDRVAAAAAAQKNRSARVVTRRHARSLPTAEAPAVPHARGLRAPPSAPRSGHQQLVAIGASGNVGTYLRPAQIKRSRATCRSLPRRPLPIATNPEMHAKRLEGARSTSRWWSGGTTATDQPWRWRREAIAVIVTPKHAWGAAQDGA